MRTFALGSIALISFIVGIVTVFNVFWGEGAPAGNGGAGITVTIHPQPTVNLPAAPTPAQDLQLATPVAAAEASSPQTQNYVVQQNDTLWDIAVKFGLTFDAILAANPSINPDQLALGQTINIPPASFVPPPRVTAAKAAPVAPQTSQGTVKPDAGGLRLRELPSTDARVITRLAENTLLQITGEVAGQTWIQVTTPNGTRGWVMAQFINIGGAVALPTLAVGGGEQAALPAPVPEGPLDYPFLSDISSRVYDIYRSGQAQGNRANAIVLVGDSNSDNPQFLAPFDWGNYNLGGYLYLQSTIDFFKGSLFQQNPAAKGGFNTASMLQAGPCGDTHLACAYNQMRPSVAIILLGTGDQHSWQSFEERYRRIVEYTIARGIIPVLVTKADDLECRDNSASCGFINAKIAQTASAYQVPLLNMRSVLERLPNGGCTGDGFHLNYPEGNKSGWFTPEYLQYGYTQRNLITLQTLDVLRRRVLQA